MAQTVGSGLLISREDIAWAQHERPGRWMCESEHRGRTHCLRGLMWEADA